MCVTEMKSMRDSSFLMVTLWVMAVSLRFVSRLVRTVDGTARNDQRAHDVDMNKMKMMVSVMTTMMDNLSFNPY